MVDNSVHTLQSYPSKFDIQFAALFHKLINKHRGKLGVFLNELHVEESTYRTDDEILQGWRQHFGDLAKQSDNPRFDEQYKRVVERELAEIIDICEASKGDYSPVAEDEVEKALNSLNKGKAADIFGLTTEHLACASNELIPVLTALLNCIFHVGDLPYSLKLGLLTPIFKKKGSNTDAKNYRGITVLPILSKLLESILRERIKPNIDATQNPMQRGFTKNSSPMNCALILEEYIRENKDQKKDSFIAFLDAKAAFDVVNHASLMRKLFHIGVEGVTWSLIHSLHREAQTVIRWCGQMSKPFLIEQGVRQGGVLSTDLYKVYVDPCLDRVTNLMIGGMVGEIPCPIPTCADDMTELSDSKEELQTLVDEGDDYSTLERYLLQPVKSVVMPVPGRGKKPVDTGDFVWTINGKPMPIVQETTHMGIKRSAISNEATVEENIKKARKMLYSLMGSGLHGYNGLDPETAVHIYQTYVLPTLVYGLEVILPEKKYMDMLERSNKKFLKHILGVPDTTADPAVYILTGTIPLEGVIHKRALSLFGNICRLDDTSIEVQLAERQLTVKDDRSHSWYIAVKNIMRKYGLPEPLDLLQCPQSKVAWKHRVNKHINNYWVRFVKERASLYPSVQYLAVDNYASGRSHHLLKSCKNARETTRVHTKLKLATGTYILQTNRASFNQNMVDPTCLLCKSAEETTQHFLLECPELAATRNPIIDSLLEACSGVCNPAYDNVTLLKLVIDCSALLDINTQSNELSNVEFQARRLCFALDCERYKKLSLIPRRNRNLKSKKSVRHKSKQGC